MHNLRPQAETVKVSALLGMFCCLVIGIPSQHLGAAAARRLEQRLDQSRQYFSGYLVLVFVRSESDGFSF